MKRGECTKSQSELNYVRQQIKEKGIKQAEVAKIMGRNHGNVSRFMSGRQTMEDCAIESLYEAGLINRPTEQDLQTVESKASSKKKEVAMPIENYTGEVLPTSAVAKEKGRTVATIRKYCKQGKLNYVVKNSRYYVCCDEKLAQLQPTELAVLKKQAAEQAEKIAALEKQIESMQLGFNFDEAEAAEELEEASADITALVAKNNMLTKENAQLRAALEQYQKTVTRQAVRTARIGETPVSYVGV